MSDGFTQVPLGRAGTGEALILPQDRQFTNFTRDILNLRAREAQEQKAQEADLQKLISDDLGTKWTQDTMKYFQPKLDEFRKEAIDVFKQNNGKLSPVQMYELQSRFGKLKQEAMLNNELYNVELKRAEELRKDLASEKPQFDIEESEKLRRMYADPYAVPQFAQDIQENYGGNVNAWRAANQKMFENVRSFSPQDYIVEKFKDRVGEEYLTDEQGNPLQQKTKEGRAYYTKIKKVQEPQIQQGLESIFTGTNYRDQRFKSEYLKRADDAPIEFKSGGVPLMDVEGWKSQEQFDYMSKKISETPELASMTAEQQRQWTAKQLAAFDIGNTFQTKQGVEWYDPRTGGGTKRQEPANIFDTARTNVPNAVTKISSSTSPAQGVNQSFEAMGFKSPSIQKDTDLARTNIDVPANITGKTFELPLTQVKALDDKNQPATIDDKMLKQYGITTLPLRVVKMSAAYTRNIQGYPRTLTAKEVKQRGADNVSKTVTARYEVDIPALKKALGRDNILEKLALQGVTGDAAQKEADILISNATKLIKSLEGKKLVRYFNLENAMDVSDLDQNYSDKANIAFKANQRSTAQEQETTTIDLNLD